MNERRQVHTWFVRASALLFCSCIAIPAAASGSGPSSQDFGVVSVGSTSQQVLVYTFNGLSADPNASLSQPSSEWNLLSFSCASMSSCTATVTFTPQFTGLRQNALVITDSISRNVLTVTFLHGLSTGPQLTMLPGVISTVVGAGPPNGYGPPSAGPPLGIKMRNPQSVALDGQGNIYVADSLSNVVLKLTTASNQVAIVAGTGAAGYTGDGSSATAATLNAPTGVALDAMGNLYIADNGNNVVRVVNTATQLISTFAGGGSAPGTDGLGDGGPATAAALFGPSAVAVDTQGNVYIADTFDNLVRKVDASLNISVAAGSAPGVIPTPGNDGLGDGGPATTATLSGPTGLALDVRGTNLYVADTQDNLVRDVDLTHNTISVIAGNGADPGQFLGDGGLAIDAELNAPNAVTADPAGNVYIADTNNFAIRKVNAISHIITTVAGLGVPGYASSGFANVAHINNPYGIALDAAGDLYLADYSNSVVQKISMSGQAFTFPTTPVGQESAPPTSPLLVINTGNQNLTFSGVTFSTNFQQQPSNMGSDCSSSIVLAAGGSCAISFVFAPTQNGVLSGTLTILTNSLNNSSSSQTVPLTGTGTGGIAQASATSASISFGNQLVTSASEMQTVTLSNSGTAALSITSVTLAGANPGDFAIAANTCGNGVAAGTSCNVGVTFTPLATGTRSAFLVFSDSANNSPQSVSLGGTGVIGGPQVYGTALRFVPITPCRVADTRNATGPFGGPILTGGTSRDFVISASNCGIPETAEAFSLNVTGVPSGPLIYLTVWPSGQAQPVVSTLNSLDGRIKANGVIVPAGDNGAISVFATNDTHVVLDINGYFVPITNTSAMTFYPLSPCRVVDTRISQGALGSPFLHGQQSRDFPLSLSSCNIPSSAQVYSLNFTVLPKNQLTYLTAWPSGQAQPIASTLNAPTGAITANASIVPAGTNGDISVYASDDTDLVIDINGYFAPPGPSGLSLYGLSPCRVFDSRNSVGSQPVGGMITIPVTTSGCNVPASAQAYVFNATVVPPGALVYLSLWQNEPTLPGFSTLNALDSTITSNLAIVPVTNGSINAYASDPTQLILDIFGYFAP